MHRQVNGKSNQIILETSQEIEVVFDESEEILNEEQSNDELIKGNYYEDTPLQIRVNRSVLSHKVNTKKITFASPVNQKSPLDDDGMENVKL